MAKPPRRAAPRKVSDRSGRSAAAAKTHAEPPDAERASSSNSGRRSTYQDAVAIYEQAVRTLQQHNYAKAADLLRHVITTFPQERELLERSRLYLALCDRHLRPTTAEPANTQERLYAATLALNAGVPERAIGYLERVIGDEPGNDQALYMLAIAHAERREPSLAIPFLERAIEANPENRSLARVDPDLEALRRDHRVTAILEAASPRPRHGNAESRRR